MWNFLPLMASAYWKASNGQMLLGIGLQDYLLLSGSLVIIWYLGFYMPFKWDESDLEAHELKKIQRELRTQRDSMPGTKPERARHFHGNSAENKQ